MVRDGRLNVRPFRYGRGRVGLAEHGQQRGQFMKPVVGF